MKKIPSLFIRDYEGYGTKVPTYGEIERVIKGYKGRFLATEQVTPGCEWVINGEGIATRKWDGTAVLFMDGKWFKRYDAKHGKTPPDDFFEAQPEPDHITGHWPGWVPVAFNTSADMYITEAIEYFNSINGERIYPGTTFEAIGPKINGNKDGWKYHTLMEHGKYTCSCQFRDFEGIKRTLDLPWEGIVFHHEDGRMCKVKRSDFGLPW